MRIAEDRKAALVMCRTPLSYDIEITVRRDSELRESCLQPMTSSFGCALSIFPDISQNAFLPSGAPLHGNLVLQCQQYQVSVLDQEEPGNSGQGALCHFDVQTHDVDSCQPVVEGGGEVWVMHELGSSRQRWNIIARLQRCNESKTYGTRVAESRAIEVHNDRWNSLQALHIYGVAKRKG